MGVEEVLRLTVAALMARSGERQGDLAAGIGQSQAQVSRKQSGRQHWSLEDVDLLAAHYHLHVLDLLAGPTHAVGVLHGVTPSLQQAGAQSFAFPSGVQASASSAASGVPAVPAAPVVPVVGPAPEPRVQLPPASDRSPGSSGSSGPASPPVRADLEVVVGLCVLCGKPAHVELDGFPQHLSTEECAEAGVAASMPPRVAVPAPVEEPGPAALSVPALVEPTPGVPVTSASVAGPEGPAAAASGASPAPSVSAAPAVVVPAVASDAPRRGAPGYASGSLVEQIAGRVEGVLAESGGDVDAAQATLIKAAIPDVMALFKASRVGGRYEHSEFPPTQEILRKKSQKGADEIWEGRPKWRNSELLAAAKRGEEIEVTVLDMNAAYLSALKAWLPIGQLREDTSGVHDPRKAGVHLVTPADWDHTGLPNPLGNRMEPGELWVSESTLRLLLDCARQGLADAPVIHRSLVSGASEALLEKLRRALAEARKNALAEGDELAVAYVKAMYSKFVSTIGESSANREIRRPDWMHIIRAKAFANLWMKANKARRAGLEVVEISGTDELHVAGDWRAVFPEGRDLNQVKEKDTYMLGGRR
ncbi:acyltransferase [Streptomyces sp. NBC_01077]|uniref:acyltransferase n=1 Tax=Streptomyces sp. NBC_01077 TaxID=2903746 RepID=UPI00386B951B|nr:acyltransferase [Streptomyces sp. NBC_01077]